MIDKNTQINSVVTKLKKITMSSIRHHKYNCALAAISSTAEILYKYNQEYVDEELERLSSDVGRKLKDKYNVANYSSRDCSDTVLIYDGFSLDTRGVILMYLNALGKNGYSVVYITDHSMQNKLPTIESMCNKYNFRMLFVDMKNYENCFFQLSTIFDKIKPKTAFYYTTPYDSAAHAVFSNYQGKCERFLIDLTDHAFWLGKNANDYFLGSREMSAYIEHYERNIPKHRCIKLGVNLLVEEVKNHDGLPFDVTKTKYVFSGGALYKTLGDPDNKFYRIVDYLLRNHEDLHFIYAGVGDERELRKIIETYPDRAYHISERSDFFYILQHCVFYLNTYPMFGGMMMKYSALAKKLPITLKHDNDSDGLLLNQEKCNIEYDSYEKLVADLDCLLADEQYLKSREQLLDGSVITETRFVNNLKSVIENKYTDYSHEFRYIDTTKFRKEYYERFDINDIVDSIITRKNISMVKYFVNYLILKLFRKRKE